MTAVAYVAQPNGYGCAIACVAMIAGMTYEEAEAWFAARGMERVRLQHGAHSGVWLEALDQLGFMYVQRYKYDAIRNGERDTWPPTPFAPVHICSARVVAGQHAVVMLGDGSVLDPYKRERVSLWHGDYLSVDNVVGVWRRP